MDSEASERVLPGFARSEAIVIEDGDGEEMTWSSGDGEDGSYEGVTEPSAREFRSVDEPDERSGEEERSTIPEAIEAASGAEASISGTFRPRVCASSKSCCARACSASAESRWRTSVRYCCSSRTGARPGVGGSSMTLYVQSTSAVCEGLRKSA